MARARTLVAAAPGGSYIEWSAILAGAIGASAISFLLLTFGAAIGLTLTSPLPNASGLTAWGTMIAVAWWAVMVQIGSFFAGGYLAGRMRARWREANPDESRFRDSTHGFMVWSVGVLMIALLAAGAGGATLKAASTAAGAALGKSDNMSAADYAADLLLRPAPRGTGAAPATAQAPGQRDEVKRIFGMAITNAELSARDRDYLAELVAARTALPQADARSRVDQTSQDTQKFEMQTRQTAEKARRYAVISGFLAAASLLISLAAAIGGAALGGRHRDDGTVANLFGTRFW
jgi:hypothetical protein